MRFDFSNYGTDDRRPDLAQQKKDIGDFKAKYERQKELYPDHAVWLSDEEVETFDKVIKLFAESIYQFGRAQVALADAVDASRRLSMFVKMSEFAAFVGFTFDFITDAHQVANDMPDLIRRATDEIVDEEITGEVADDIFKATKKTAKRGHAIASELHAAGLIGESPSFFNPTVMQFAGADKGAEHLFNGVLHKNLCLGCNVIDIIKGTHKLDPLVEGIFAAMKKNEVLYQHPLIKENVDTQFASGHVVIEDNIPQEIRDILKGKKRDHGDE